jgi:hypothetical protein
VEKPYPNNHTNPLEIAGLKDGLNADSPACWSSERACGAGRLDVLSDAGRLYAGALVRDNLSR